MKASKIWFYLGFTASVTILPGLVAKQAINSGGGWAHGSSYSSFNSYGEIYIVNRAREGKYNRPPVELSALGVLSVKEGSPMGTKVGEFEAFDPDGDDLQFSLVSGDGDSGNRFFSLSSKGTLSSKWALQNQASSSHFIRVRVGDGKGADIEKVFSVKVLEGHAPIVDTLLPYATEDGQFWMGGRVLDPGMSVEDLEVGILVSGRPIVDADAKGVLKGKLRLADDDENFGFEFFPDESMDKLYVVAYARNEKGTSYGLQERVDLLFPGVEDSPKASLYSFAEPIDGAPGWWNSLWFGNFYHSEQSGWLLHLDLGWLYPSATVGDGLWFWKESIGWFWTKSDLYPFLYSSNSNGWMYFYGDLDQRRLLFDYARKKWIRLDETQIDEKEGAR